MLDTALAILPPGVYAMTVRELIAALAECNLDAVVYTTFMPDDDGDLVIQKVAGITPRGTLNRTADRISLDLED